MVQCRRFVMQTNVGDKRVANPNIHQKPTFDILSC
jgi:hypothetical protein